MATSVCLFFFFIYMSQELQAVDRFKEQIFNQSKSIHENSIETTKEV